jgi:hypothetical protein
VNVFQTLLALAINEVIRGFEALSVIDDSWVNGTFYHSFDHDYTSLDDDNDHANDNNSKVDAAIESHFDVANGISGVTNDISGIGKDIFGVGGRLVHGFEAGGGATVLDTVGSGSKFRDRMKKVNSAGIYILNRCKIPAFQFHLLGDSFV